MASVLVVDDYFVTQRVLTFMLRKSGHTVFNASHGQEALNILDLQPIDLAIVDLAMPVMDGLTLLRRLRMQARFADLPVIMLTASGDDIHRIVSKAEGAGAFLSKPIGSQELLAAVDRCLMSAVRI